MIRTLDGQVRAVLSERYRRLDNYDLAENVLPILQRLDGARFESVELTDTKMYLKVVTPRGDSAEIAYPIVVWRAGTITVDVPGEPSRVVQIIVLITVLGVAPSVLLLCTSFTKIVVVLSLTRSALGTMSIPPNQVLVGLALFLSLFVMGPTLDQMQSQGLKPYMDGTKTSQEAYTDGVVPLRDFMLEHTRDEELALMTKAAGRPLPKDRASVDLRTLVPAFVLSELRAAFIIGFVVFVPFLVIDMVVSAGLMSVGMMMLPPVMISLPFKLLLFVLVDGWVLLIGSLVASVNGVP